MGTVSRDEWVRRTSKGESGYKIANDVRKRNASNGGNNGDGGGSPNPTGTTVTQKAFDTYDAINNGSYKKNYMQDSYIGGGWKQDKNIDPRAGSVIANSANNGLANKMAESMASATATISPDGKTEANPVYTPALGDQMRNYLSGKADEYYRNNDTFKDVSDSDMVYRYIYDQNLSDDDRAAVLGMLQRDENANYAAHPEWADYGINAKDITNQYNDVVFGKEDENGARSGGYSEKDSEGFDTAEDAMADYVAKKSEMEKNATAKANATGARPGSNEWWSVYNSLTVNDNGYNALVNEISNLENETKAREYFNDYESDANALIANYLAAMEYRKDDEKAQRNDAAGNWTFMPYETRAQIAAMREGQDVSRFANVNVTPPTAGANQPNVPIAYEPQMPNSTYDATRRKLIGMGYDPSNPNFESLVQQWMARG